MEDKYTVAVTQDGRLKEVHVASNYLGNSVGSLYRPSGKEILLSQIAYSSEDCGVEKPHLIDEDRMPKEVQ